MHMYKNKKYLTAFVLIFISVYLLFNFKALAISVKPLSIDLNTRPGKKEQFEIAVTSSQNQEVIKLSFYDVIQDLNGNLYYKKISGKDKNNIWVNIDKDEIITDINQKTLIKGTVSVPYNAGGVKNVIIMVEPQNSKGYSGISFKVRYAVRLNIRVNKPGIRKYTSLDEFDIIKGESGQPIISAKINNPSKWDFLVSAEATIRDKNRRLVKRIMLKSPASMNSSSNQTRIYPGSKVKFYGEIIKRLKPGTYNLRIFVRYGEHGQIIENKEIKIKEGQYNFPKADEIGAFSVDHERINLKLKPGERKTIPLKLQSEIGEDSVIVVESKDIEPDYKYSNQEWLKLFNADQVNLRGRMSNRIVTSALVPRDVEDGSYNGVLLIKAFNPETEELLEVEEIPVSILVGENHNPGVKMRSILSNKVEEGYLLSVDILNSGNISIKPGAEVIIKNENDEFVERVELSIIEDEELIIPLMPGQLTGIASNLGEGEYKLEITVFNNEDEIKKFEETIVIK